MSTETRSPSSAARAFREAADMRRFRRTSWALVTILALLAVGLAAANAAQGPRVASGTFNADAAIARAGQRLVLDADQPLAEITASDVTITPDAPIELTADDRTVTVRFTGLLRYATAYSVEVAVRGTATGAAGTLRYEFETPDVDVLALVRGPDGDRVLRHRLSSPAADTLPVFAADRIQEYAITGDVLVAVTLDDADRPSLRLAARDGIVTTLATPPASSIRELEAASATGLIGYLVDPPAEHAEAGTRLHVLDLAEPSGVSTEVAGPGGSALAVRDWAFVPGTGSLVVQSDDGRVFLVDPLTGAEPVPLGQHAELRGFLPGTPTLVVADPTSGSLLDLAAGRMTVLDLPEPDVDPLLAPGPILLLDATRYVELYANPYGSPLTPHRSLITLTTPEGTRELYRPPTPTARVGRMCLAPNGQYLAVEVVPADAEPDRYPSTPGHADTTIYYVDAVTGAVNRGVRGMLPDWC